MYSHLHFRCNILAAYVTPWNAHREHERIHASRDQQMSNVGLTVKLVVQPYLKTMFHSVVSWPVLMPGVLRGFTDQQREAQYVVFKSKLMLNVTRSWCIAQLLILATMLAGKTARQSQSLWLVPVNIPCFLQLLAVSRGQYEFMEPLNIASSLFRRLMEAGMWLGFMTKEQWAAQLLASPAVIVILACLVGTFEQVRGWCQKLETKIGCGEPVLLQLLPQLPQMWLYQNRHFLHNCVSSPTCSFAKLSAS